MIPFHFNYGPKKDDGSPRHPADFDLPYAYHALGPEVRRGERSTWKTRAWVNCFCAAVASVIGYGFWFAFTHEYFGTEAPLLGRLAYWIFALILFAAFLLLSLMSLTRGRLVLDRRSRELTFYRFWFSLRPHRKLGLDGIRALSRRAFESPGGADDPGHTYDILVAELQDGRVASIAIDSPLSIEIEVQKTAGLKPSASSRRSLHLQYGMEQRRGELSRLRN